MTKNFASPFIFLIIKVLISKFCELVPLFSCFYTRKNWQGFSALAAGICALNASNTLHSVEYAPWYPPTFELQPRLNVTYQNYTRVASYRGSFHDPSYGTFYDASIGAAYFGWYGSLELKLADTSARAFGVDTFCANGRYLLMDDVAAEDPVSLTVGATIINANRRSLLDRSSFHHGQLEGEILVALGKETSSGAYWATRLWALAALGCADVGSPWLHGRVQWDRNHEDRYTYSFFINALYGMGSSDLAKHKPFRGYGPIQHRSIDLGIHYCYTLENGLNLLAGATYRCYAVNFPQQVFSLTASLLYPFGP